MRLLTWIFKDRYRIVHNKLNTIEWYTVQCRSPWWFYFWTTCKKFSDDRDWEFSFEEEARSWIRVQEQAPSKCIKVKKTIIKH